MMFKVFSGLAVTLSLVALYIGVRSATSVRAATWDFTAESVTLEAPSEDGEQQGFTLSPELLAQADGVHGPSIDWTRKDPADPAPEVLLLPPKAGECRALSLALRRESANHLTLSLSPQETHACPPASQKWTVFVSSSPKTLEYRGNLDVTLKIQNDEIDVFQDLRAKSVHTGALKGPVNPLRALSLPLPGDDQELLVEADEDQKLRLASISIRGPSPPERLRAAIRVVLRAAGYRKLRIDGQERSNSWLWQWPTSASLAMIVIPLAQLLMGTAQLTRAKANDQRPTGPAWRIPGSCRCRPGTRGSP